MPLHSCVLFFFLLCLLPLHAGAAGETRGPVPVPKGLAIRDPGDPGQIASAFLGIPYRFDGAIDESGAFSLFAEPSRRFSSPGLNCSGLVLAASRFFLGRNIPLATATRDRLGDSGPGAPQGEDWDFGWDLIMNISEGHERRLLLPGGTSTDPAAATGFAPRGYDIHDPATWEELPSRLVPGSLYLVSLNVEGRRKGYGLQHYHVGFIHVDASGAAWFTQTTGKGGVSNRRDLNSAQGRASFRKSFADTKGRSAARRRMMLVLAVTLP